MSNGPELIRSQREHWNRSVGKNFGHPLSPEWVAKHVPRAARVLDFGRGYGRLLGDLRSLGYRNLVGVDFAPKMIEAALENVPEATCDLATLPLPYGSDTFDAVLLFAVLTCIPACDDQRAVAQDISRVLKPRGILILSDMPFQADGRHKARYRDGAARFGTYGVFETSDGAIVRHHSEDELLDRFPDMIQLDRRTVPVVTMNGTAATAMQFILQKRPAVP